MCARCSGRLPQAPGAQLPGASGPSLFLVAARVCCSLQVELLTPPLGLDTHPGAAAGPTRGSGARPARGGSASSWAASAPVRRAHGLRGSPQGQ